MGWKTWPYWLKGGIILAGLAFLIDAIFFSKLPIFLYGFAYTHSGSQLLSLPLIVLFLLFSIPFYLVYSIPYSLLNSITFIIGFSDIFFKMGQYYGSEPTIIGNIFIFLIGVVIWFAIGAIIGLIIGRVKGKNNKRS